MDISELKQELLEGKVRPFYVFTGDEVALQDIYINKIGEIANLEVKRIDNVVGIVSHLNSKSFIKTKKVVYVCRQDETYLTSKSWKRFIEAKSLKGNILILLYSGIKSSSDFYKQHEKVLTEFNFMGGNLLRNRLMAITGMPAQYCDDIVKMCGNNYGRIQNEFNKLRTFAIINNYSFNTAYLEAKKQNMIHEEIGDIIFDFTNAVVERNIKKAYELWPKMKFTGDGPMRVLSVLYNSFRQILMVQSTPNELRTEEALGIKKGLIYVTNQKCGRYNLFELVHIVKTLQYLESGVKLGIIAEEFAMEYLMGVIW